jgi:hypothetical protein
MRFQPVPVRIQKVHGVAFARIGLPFDGTEIGKPVSKFGQTLPLKRERDVRVIAQSCPRGRFIKR